MTTMPSSLPLFGPPGPHDDPDTSAVRAVARRRPRLARLKAQERETSAARQVARRLEDAADRLESAVSRLERTKPKRTKGTT